MTAVTTTPVGKAGSAPRRRGLPTKTVDTITASIFLAPGMIMFIAFVIVPVVLGLALSFYSWDLFSDPVFVGLDNITRLIVDPRMWDSLFVSFLFVLLGVIPTTIIGFLLAVVVNSRMRGVGYFRVLYLAPLVASSAVSSLIWINIFQTRSGILNQILGAVGIAGPNWLSDPVLARPSLVVIMIWSSLPLVIVLYISGLQRVSEDIYAAASLDGAGKWRQLWTMTWPNVQSTTAVVLILMFVGFLSGSFELALIMTNGGPLDTTTSLALYAYKEAFNKQEVGYASALSLFQLVVIGVIFVIGRTAQKAVKARS